MPTNRTLKSRAFLHAAALVVVVFGGFVILGVGCSERATNAPQQSLLDAGTYDLGDAAIPENLTDTAACARYVLSTCQRRNECLGTKDNCFDAVSYCPDLLFSQGSTRDPKTTWACADAMRTRSCKDVITGKNPSCISSGVLKAGEPCMSAAQCSSLSCTGSPFACGVCVERRKKGDACNSTDAPCVPGLLCDPTSSICVEPSSSSIEEKLADVPLALGNTCIATSTCVKGAYCSIPGGKTEGTCAVRIAQDAECQSTGSCIEGTYCSTESMRCRAVPSVGARCGNDIKLNVLMWCDDNSYCSDETSQCTLLPAAESPCATNDQLANIPTLCDKASFCDVKATPPTCKALTLAGERCSDETCANGLSCLCDDAACTTKSCGVVRGFGESCAAPGEHCLYSIGNCANGVCQANASQQLFALLCGR